MAKRIYWETIKKWAMKVGVPVGVASFTILFMYLSFLGVIEVTGHSGDMVCAGTIEDPCIALINFTANEDIFIYPVGYDPWGRDTPFETDKGLRGWHIYRSWGSGWREIKLNETCPGTWCGAPNNLGVKYSFVFRKDRDYQIKMVGYKEDPKEDIKWGFGPVDPTWYGLDYDERGLGFDRICNDGKCNLVLYSGVRNVYEDNQWKRVEDARSLKDKGFNIVYLETDGDFILEVIDFNYTDIELESTFIGDPAEYPEFCDYKSEIEFKCQFKNTIKWFDDEGIEQTLKYDLKYEMKDGIMVVNDTKFSYKGNPLGKKYTFGGYSITIMLQDANSENLIDSYVEKDDAGTVHGVTDTTLRIEPDPNTIQRAYIMFNISAIPISVDLGDSTLYLYKYIGSTEDSLDVIDVHYISDTSWDGENESSLTWNNQVCGVNFDDSGDCDLSAEDSFNPTTADGVWYDWNVTEGVSTSYVAEENNVSFALKDSLEESALGYAYFRSKEYTTDITLRPYLNITYTPPPVYNLSITDPTTANPNTTVSGENISIVFDFLEDNVNITSGVTMENVMIGGSFATILSASGPLANTTLFYDGAETGWGAGNCPGEIPWDTCDDGSDSGASLSSSTTNPDNGSRTIRFEESNDAYLIKDVDTSDYIEIYLSFCWAQDNIDSGETGTIKVDGNVIDTITYVDPSSDNSYECMEWALVEDEGITPSVDTEFRFDMGNVGAFEGGEEVFIDDFHVRGEKISITQQFGYVSGVGWQVNVTVPVKDDGTYDLFVNATYDGKTRGETETNAIIYGEAPAADTCTCPGAGENWEVNMSHYCNHTSPGTLTTGNLSWIGSSGYFNCSAQLNLTNRDAPPSSTTFYHSSGCELIYLIILIFISTTMFKRKRRLIISWHR